jgi:catechol-2,3-dioxygenase
MLQIQTLDPLVLTVRDIAATCAFYQTVLGMKGVTCFSSGDRHIQTACKIWAAVMSRLSSSGEATV